MKFLSCRDEGSILTSEHEPTERRALLDLTTCGPVASEVVGGTQDHKPIKLRVFSLAELETATGGFGKPSLLGKGSHGCLYKGTLKDGRQVAVKRQEFLQDEAAFNNELEILSTVHGPRFVNLVGFSRGLDAQEKLLVVDFMANGTLYDMLHHSGTHSSSNTTSSAGAAPVEPLGWSLRVQIAMQTAKALLTLHSQSPPVIHRDVKSSSVLIDSKWNAKLGDFGLALRGRSEENVQGRGSSAGGGGSAPPVGYIDSEDDSTPGSRISTKVDVFSFGILLLELLSGRNAIDVRFKPPSIIDWALPLIKQGKAHAIYDRRLLLLPHYSKALRLMAGIAARCVRRCSLRRPSMSYVVAALQDVSKKVPTAKWADGLATVMKKTTSGCQTQTMLRDVRPAGPDLINGPRTPAQIAKPRLAVDKPVPLGKALPLPPPPQQTLEQQQDYYTNVALSKFVSRVSSIDRLGGGLRPTSSRLREHRSSSRVAHDVGFLVPGGDGHHQRHPSFQDEREGDGGDEIEDEEGDKEAAVKGLPRAIMEVSLGGGRKRIYNQWRNPMFDLETRSPERPLMHMLPVDVGNSRSTTADHHRFGTLSDGMASAIPMVRLDDEARGRGAALVPRPSSTATTPTREGGAATEEGPSLATIPLSMSNKVRSRNVRSSSRKSHVKTRDNFEREEAMLPW